MGNPLGKQQRSQLVQPASREKCSGAKIQPASCWLLPAHERVPVADCTLKQKGPGKPLPPTPLE